MVTKEPAPAKQIIDLVRARKAVLQVNEEEAERNRAKSVRAIEGGINSLAWEQYMQQYAETPEQLERLKGTDGTRNDTALAVKRAYLVANAVCGPTTPTDLDRFVSTIDDPPAT